MLQLQQHIPTDLTFSWTGAFCGFVAFQHCIGNILAKKIYKSFGEGEGFGSITNPRIAGSGLAVNYALQILACVLAGGYSTGTMEARTGVSMDGNKAVMATMAAIWLWSKIFADSPWLSRRFGLMIQWVSDFLSAG
ncbi:hypothetical protein M409DRAFT_24209 [Zasmidium cellare ATCC 36951]|uniref:Uncharacterized protein n=1 Tax=Zasmidium cellare ATCC 36951 TaxID=1080233 RepID=A0A6A6CI40_ZASCE|nr:uncharacterized protein M409DRAFT_24209 [Zasmidium cellare ATCC 36951]KAF2165359.1 hypothetical protein M409DRAFT_24209 [Zasmidium cellare ATCC 36951]